MAVGLQIYDITGSTFSVGLLGIFALVPLVALGLYGGALVDAYDRRRVALFSALGLWVVVLGLVAQALLGMESVELLYGLVALQSAGFAINNPARTAIIPRLVEPRLLPAANVLQTVAWNIALTVGPLIAAFLVAGPGFAAAYAVDAVLFTAALWALWRLPGLPPIVGPDDKRLRLGLSAVVDGFRYLATRPNVRMTFVVDLIAMIVAMPRVLFPAVGVLFLGGGAFTTGVLSAAFAAGAVLAGLFSGGLVRVVHQGRVIVSAIAVVRARGGGLRCGAAHHRRRSASGRALAPARPGRAVPGPRRRLGLRQLRVPPDHPAVGDPGRHARTPAGHLHRRRGRWAAARRPGPRHGGDLDGGELGRARRWAALRRARPRGRRHPTRILGLRRPRPSTVTESPAGRMR